MPGLGGRGAAGAGATSAGLEGAAALDFGAAALRAVGFAFLSADFFGALFLAAECFFFRGGAALFAFFVFLVFDFVFFAMIVLPIARHYSVRFNRVAVQPFALPAALTEGNQTARRPLLAPHLGAPSTISILCFAWPQPSYRQPLRPIAALLAVPSLHEQHGQRPHIRT